MGNRMEGVSDIRKHILPTIVALALLLCGPLGIATVNAAAQQDMVSGVVESIDKADGKIRLKHGPIKSLGMDVGMTMSFRVQDPAFLTNLNTGDKVRFQAEQINGLYTVTKIEKAN